FTEPVVYLGRGAIVQADDERFDSDKGPLQFDQEGVRVAVVAGEGSHEFVMTHFQNTDAVIVFSGSDLAQSLAAVSAGQADVGLSDALETAKYSEAHTGVRDLYASSPHTLTPIAWAVRHEDDDFRVFLNTALELLFASGRIHELAKPHNYNWTIRERTYSKLLTDGSAQ
ncbi:MAG: transporter substrate-binding domain-containing protein, partial [Pseudomonadota bacterium]